ncbi:glycosyltransferase family 2 protein, partial [Patulibacter sp. S7RM1-6]
GAPRARPDRRAPRLMPLAAAVDVLRDLLRVGEDVALAALLLLNGGLLALLAVAASEVRRQHRSGALEARWRLLGSDVAPRISVLAPVHDAAGTVADDVRRIVAMRYPNIEVVVVDDGSDDDTLAVLVREFDLRPRPVLDDPGVEHRPIRAVLGSSVAPCLTVVATDHGGKAAALNAGLAVASGELVCVIDAGTIVEPEALLRLARPFLLHDDAVAAGGVIRVANGATIEDGRVVRPGAPRRFLAGVQAVEYLRAFVGERLGWNPLGGPLVVPGAFGLFRRDALLATGGYRAAAIGGDIELLARVRRYAHEHGGPGRAVAVPDVVAWAVVPEDARALAAQRLLWHGALVDVLRHHRDTALRRRYGRLGLVAYPYGLLAEIVGPIAELLGLLGLALGLAVGAFGWAFVGLFLLVAYGLGVLRTVLTVALEEWTYRAYGGGRESLLLLGWALLEPLGYRQVAALWRLRGLRRSLRGRSRTAVPARDPLAGPRR